MQFSDIISQITISDRKVSFHTGDGDWKLFTEYLNNILYYKEDPHHFKNLERLIFTSTEEDLEKYIMEQIRGFMFIDKKPYAFIGGANEFSASVILDWRSKYLFFYHPNTNELSKYPLAIDELRKIVRQCNDVTRVTRA